MSKLANWISRGISVVDIVQIMHLVDEDTHRALAYVAAANRGGAVLTDVYLTQFFANPHLIRAKYESDVFGAFSRSLQRALGSSVKVSDGESVGAYLERLGWAKGSPEDIRLTDVGRAVLRDLDNPRVEVDSDAPISVVVDPKDPLAYVRIFDLVSSQSQGTLVDPYLGLSELLEILQNVPTVSRVLFSDHGKTKKFPLVAKALGVVAAPPEVRYLPLREMHDRFFIPDAGDVLVFGSSLNSITKRPGVVTPITDVAAGGAIRDAYRVLWDSANPITPVAP